jgi:hypothetical protein
MGFDSCHGGTRGAARGADPTAEEAPRAPAHTHTRRQARAYADGPASARRRVRPREGSRPASPEIRVN